MPSRLQMNQFQPLLPHNFLSDHHASSLSLSLLPCQMGIQGTIRNIRLEPLRMWGSYRFESHLQRDCSEPGPDSCCCSGSSCLTLNRRKFTYKQHEKIISKDMSLIHVGIASLALFAVLGTGQNHV